MCEPSNTFSSGRNTHALLIISDVCFFTTSHLKDTNIYIVKRVPVPYNELQNAMTEEVWNARYVAVRRSVNVSNDAFMCDVLQ